MTDQAKRMSPIRTSLNLEKSNLEQFAATLQALLERNPDIVVVCSDSRGSGKLTSLGKAFPDRLIEVGIAEQNLVGIAAGLASCGKKVFAVSPASFLTARALEQIKNDVCYSDNPVVLVGISAGVSYGALGSTHHSLHDLAVLRCIHNLTIMAPADNFETDQSIRHAAQAHHPVYLRFGKAPMHRLHDGCGIFQPAQACMLREGQHLCFVATGEMVRQCYFAAEWLERMGIQAGVLSMHTIKPFDKQALLDVADATRCLIVAEEHSIHGGLGEACASVLMEHGRHATFRIAGIPDEHTYTGSQMEIFEHYGLTPEGLVDLASSLLETSHA